MFQFKLKISISNQVNMDLRVHMLVVDRETEWQEWFLFFLRTYYFISISCAAWPLCKHLHVSPLDQMNRMPGWRTEREAFEVKFCFFLRLNAFRFAVFFFKWEEFLLFLTSNCVYVFLRTVFFSSIFFFLGGGGLTPAGCMCSFISPWRFNFKV